MFRRLSKVFQFIDHDPFVPLSGSPSDVTNRILCLAKCETSVAAHTLYHPNVLECVLESRTKDQKFISRLKEKIRHAVTLLHKVSANDNVSARAKNPYKQTNATLARDSSYKSSICLHIRASLFSSDYVSDIDIYLFDVFFSYNFITSP